MKGTTVIQEGKHIFCLMNDDGLEPHRPCNILLVFGPVRAKNMDFCWCNQQPEKWWRDRTIKNKEWEKERVNIEKKLANQKLDKR